MRISDWSSDVCSSDLDPLFAARRRRAIGQISGPRDPRGRALLALSQDGRAAGRDGTPLRPRQEPRRDRTLSQDRRGSRPASCHDGDRLVEAARTEEPTSETQSPMPNSYSVLRFKKKNTPTTKKQ